MAQDFSSLIFETIHFEKPLALLKFLGVRIESLRLAGDLNPLEKD